jgi:nucleoside-diphosphate-sugar epimerase
MDQSKTAGGVRADAASAPGRNRREDPPVVAVTGAAGRVGGLTIGALAGLYRLRLIDLDWSGEPEDETLPDNAERMTCDLRDPAACAAAVDSVDVLVHLAAQPSPQIGVREAVRDVAMPTANIAEAAAASAIRRVVLASSIHSMGLYDRWGTLPIRPEWPNRPCCEYGSAKVLCENLLGLLAERSGVSVVCLRLGLTGAPPTTPRARGHWLGDDDYANLIRAAVTADVQYGTYFGVSRTASTRWETSNGRSDLGYVPSQDAPDAEASDPPSEGGRCLMG